MPPQRPPRSVETTPATPLHQVRLSNFKSVKDASVELRPLTAIVGRNSSGKSTLLQGILALAQAVRREVVSPSFPLNGDLVRLGTFDEVRNFDADAADGLEIGFTAEVDFWPPNAPRVSGSRRRTASALVDWTAHLTAPAPDTGAGQATFDTIEFAVRSEDTEIDPTNVTLSASNFSDEPSLGPVPLRAPGVFSRFGAEVSVDGRLFDRRTGQSTPVDIMSMSGGLPWRVFRTANRFDVSFRNWWDVAWQSTEIERREARQVTADQLDSDDTAVREKALDTIRRNSQWALKFAADCIADEDTLERGVRDEVRSAQRRLRLRSGLHGFELDRFDQAINGLSKARKANLANAMNEMEEAGFKVRLRDRLESAGVNWLDQSVRDEPSGDVHDVLEQVTGSTLQLFQQVRYLGPLRAKPQAMYSPGIRQVDLGPEGELSAAYLHANARKRTLVPIPSGGAQLMELGAGLNLWLEELGLADTAQAKDQGRLGIGLYVQPVGRSQSVDLTSVGVGVSQALPVILLCLLATPDSIVLIEQPELHLHPAMQLRLADFLLACARTGRQIIVETHSEHLINRLRRRVVEDDSGSTGDVVRLLFAEQDKGETVYRISDINEMGGLDEDWPAGFLDVAADESTRLLEQTLARRRSKTAES